MDSRIYFYRDSDQQAVSSTSLTRTKLLIIMFFPSHLHGPINRKGIKKKSSSFATRKLIKSPSLLRAAKKNLESLLHFFKLHNTQIQTSGYSAKDIEKLFDPLSKINEPKLTAGDSFTGFFRNDTFQLIEYVCVYKDSCIRTCGVTRGRELH